MLAATDADPAGWLAGWLRDEGWDAFDVWTLLKLAQKMRADRNSFWEAT